MTYLAERNLQHCEQIARQNVKGIHNGNARTKMYKILVAYMNRRLLRREVDGLNEAFETGDGW